MENLFLSLKCLEDYKRKKLEQELGEQPGGSARMCSSSTMSLNNRGQSQPPFRRPKSQTNVKIKDFFDSIKKFLA